MATNKNSSYYKKNNSTKQNGNQNRKNIESHYSTTTNTPSVTDNEVSYCNDFLKAYNSQLGSSGYFIPPQLLNFNLKGINMEGAVFSQEEIERMIMAPHQYEQELRRLSYMFYNTISIYRRNIDFQKVIPDFDWEPIPYCKDGKQIDQSDFSSYQFKRDYAIMTNFFNCFDVKREFRKVLFNILLYDTYYISIRKYDDHIYLQELPSKHCIIDSTSYLGYLFSFDLSYFTNSGVDINGYSPALRKKYSEVLKLKESTYNPNLPQRNGAWVYWNTMSPDDSWVFKYNSGFAGSVPPALDMLMDYSKIRKFKDLEEAKKKLEAYKVIFATVPRMSSTRSANKADNFAISSSELGKFVATVKQTLDENVDFKAAPLEDFKAFDFSPSASEKDLLETEISNMLRESGLSDAILTGGTGVSANNMYKTVMSELVKSIYPQFERFCEYQINKQTKKYKFKIKFVGSIFDREERRKASNEDMERGIITPAIFSSRGIQLTDANNVSNMMYHLGFPELFRPIKTASTMSSKEKEVGRNKKNDSELTDAGEYTRQFGSNENREKEGG